MTARPRLSEIFLLCLATVTLCATARADLTTNKLRVLLSASETKGEGDTNWTTNWNLDGAWQTPTWGQMLHITLDSDFAKSDNAKLDRLRTGFRMLGGDYGTHVRKWYPVYLLQTEGDHGFDSLHTLAAAGFRQKRRYGYFEATAGASKDLQTGQSWVGDVGFEVGYERNLGDKWKVSTGPKAEYGAIGSVRLRDDRMRYSWDVSVDYQATEKLGFGYRLWYGNTVPDSDRTQWIGVTYKLK